MKIEVSSDQLSRLLKQVIGSSVEIAEMEVANRQQDYLVLLVQLRHPAIKVVIKFAGPEARMASSFDRTAMLDRLVADHTSIPIPEILAVDMSYQPWRYLIKTYIPGQGWAYVREGMTVEERSSAYRQIGQAVAQLHSLSWPDFGELGADGSVQGEGAYPHAFNERARRTIKNRRLYDSYCEVLERHRQLFLEVHHASLCHEDLHAYNILFHHDQGQWQLATILDFDKAWAGHREIDLARMEFWTGQTSVEFWQAYQEICPIDSRYPSRRPIYQLLWCLEVAWSSNKHLADTQSLCTQLGMPFPGYFD
jgi:fructosamine-3-kinase